jgi:hypothetical protein
VYGDSFLSSRQLPTHDEDATVQVVPFAEKKPPLMGTSGGFAASQVDRD